MLTNLSIVLKIGLVGDDNDRERVLVFDTENLLVEGGDFLKRASGRNRVNKQEALSGTHVLFPHRAVVFQSRRPRQITRLNEPIFFLTCSIKNIQKCDLVVNDALFAIRICGENKNRRYNIATKSTYLRLLGRIR